MPNAKQPVDRNTYKKYSAALEARGVTAHDLKDIVEALVGASFRAGNAHSDEDGLAEAVSTKVDALTAAGLGTQVEWLAGYYETVEDLEWGLSGYLNLPELELA
jgi:hypothetical protein